MSPFPHPFTLPARRSPVHRLALGAAILSTALAGVLLLVPETDEMLARVLPLSLVALFAVLVGLLARLGRATTDKA